MTSLPPSNTTALCVNAGGQEPPHASMLIASGVTLSFEADARRALATLESHPVDLVMVASGGALTEAALAFCVAVRKTNLVPLIAVFDAESSEDERVRAFEAGVDDCVVASWGPKEMLARIAAVLRRVRWQPLRKHRLIEAGKLSLDLGAMVARYDGRVLNLTQYEFEVLKALAEQAGRVLSREELMEKARGNAEESFDRSIDVHICRLRAKLGDVRRRPQVLKTVRGVGYLFDPAPSDGA